MKVRELVAKLNTFDPDAEITVEDPDTMWIREFESLWLEKTSSTVVILAGNYLRQN